MSNIAVKGATTGTGTFTLESPATNTDRTLVLPDEAGTVLTSAGVPASALPAGSVIQVVSVSNQTVYTTTSSSYSGTFTASITPTSSSSKVLILVNCAIFNSGASGAGIALTRGGSSIWLPSVADGGGPYGALYGVTGGRMLTSMSYLDSPATTSSTAYGISLASRSGTTATLNPTDVTTGGSTITLMEIAA